MSELKHLSPQAAHRLLADNPRAVLVDIRSTMESLFVGHSKGALHIPWMDEPEWTVNPHFVTRVRELMLGGALGSDAGAAPVILIWRSGKRSLAAGRNLVAAGFSEIYNILEGFAGDLGEQRHRGARGGWRLHDLPGVQCRPSAESSLRPDRRHRGKCRLGTSTYSCGPGTTPRSGIRAGAH